MTETNTVRVRGRRPARVSREFKGWSIYPQGENLWGVEREGTVQEGFLTITAAKQAIQALDQPE